jgi:hypothetical protein
MNTAKHIIRFGITYYQGLDGDVMKMTSHRNEALEIDDLDLLQTEIQKIMDQLKLNQSKPQNRYFKQKVIKIIPVNN